MCKNIFIADLLGSQYLFEILQTSLNVKNSKNIYSINWMFRKTFATESTNFFFEMKKGYKISCVKILIFC